MSAQAPPTSTPVTTRSFARAKLEHRKLTMVTAYDATFARLVDDAGIDAILVGDSLGMVIQGQRNTLAVSVDEMAYHVRAVAAGSKRASIIADLPFLSYHGSIDDAVLNAGKMLQAGAHAVKLEGGVAVAPTVARMVSLGIPVMGHVGLLPQSMHAQGGFVMQGKDQASEQRIFDDARALVDAGAYSVVVEGVPADVAATLTAQLPIPTIGIGAGNACDGQVLVLYDLLGLNPTFTPRFVKTYLDGASLLTQALRAYADDVKTGTFPGDEHTYRRKRDGTS
jgi:3-methyl-2-oxobutanoate hydroxymethyltransferase